MNYSIGSGEISIGIILHKHDRMNISSGGTANSTTVDGGGDLYIYSGGTASNTTLRGYSYFDSYYASTVINLGRLYVYDGGTATNTMVNSNGYLSVSSGGTANSTTVISRGALYVSNGGTANDTTINYVGYLYVSSGGTANDTTVKNGWLYVSSGGMANSTTVNSGGGLNVSSGGTATNISVSNGGWLHLTVAPDTYIQGTSAGSAFRMENAFISGYTVNTLCDLWVIDGGTANSTTVNSGGWLYVSIGGMATNTTVNSGGNLWVIDGGTANYTTVVLGGRLYVSSGGTANSTTVNSGGWLYVSSGGTATNTTVNSGGWLYVSSGGTAAIAYNPWQGTIVSSAGADVTYLNRDAEIYYGNSNDIVSKYDYLENFVITAGYSAVMFGGTANSTTVNSGGWLYVSSGGTATNTTVNSGGWLYVSSGGTAAIAYNPWQQGTIVSSAGADVTYLDRDAEIYYGNSSNGIVSKYDYLENFVITAGYSAVMFGGTANSTTVNSGGWLYVSSGGTANNTTVNSGGWLYVSSGGTAAIAYNPWHQGTIVSSAGADVTYLNRDAEIYYGNSNGIVSKYDYLENFVVTAGYSAVMFGGTANFTTLNGGWLYISSGGAANNTTVNSRGELTVCSGGTANSTTVNSGWLYVSSGGAANNTTVNSRGELTVCSGGTANSTTVNYGWLYVSSGGTANNTTVNSRGELTVCSGGTATNTTVDLGGSLWVDSGGTATSIVENGGYVYVADVADVTFIPNAFSGLSLVNGREATVHSGTTAVSTTVNTHCGLTVFSGGTATNTMVNSGGRLWVDSGGTATSIVEKGGYVDFANGAYVSFTPHSFSGLVLSSGSATVHSGTTATNTTVDYRGHMYVSSGGTANSTTVSGGGLYVSSGGTATNTTVSDGSMYVSSGGTATNTTVSSYGCMYVYDGGTANSTMVRGYSAHLSVTSGGTANSTTVNADGSLYVYDGCTANSTTVSGYSAHLYISSGGTANSTTVNQYGSMTVSRGGTANGAVINVGGTLFISHGGKAIDASVKTGGNLIISSGGTIGGLQIQYGAAVSAMAGAAVEFDLTSRTITDAAIIDNFALIQGMPDYTVSISTNQANGNYKLAAGASYFAAPITIRNTAGISSTLILGETVSLGDLSCTLNIESYTLTLTVNNINKVLPAVPIANANITSLTNQNVTVTAVFSEDSAQKQYSLDNKTWNAYTSGIVMSANGTVYFRGIDAAGNISNVTGYTVNNIDKVAPDAPTASASTTAPTNQNVTVTAVFSNDSAQKQYSLNNRNWRGYTSGVVFAQNGTIWFRGIDAAGNISEVTSYTVNNIELPENTFVVAGDQSGTQNVNVSTAGKYILTGDFGDITGTVTVFNGGKKAGTGTLKNGVLTFNKGQSVLLDDSLETVIQVTVKKGTDTQYTATLSAVTVFDKGDNDSKNAPRQLGSVTEPGMLVPDGWVGYGDEVDFLAFTLDHAANLSLDYTATDAAKFTLVNAVTGKSVMNSSVKANVPLTTKPKLVEAGSYYLQVQSTNAKKGGDADYTVSVNSSTVFFTKGDNSDDTMATAKNLGSVTGTGYLFDDWVGFGDVVDYRKFTLDTAAKLQFTTNSSDAVKFTVYQLDAKGKLKSLGNVIKKGRLYSDVSRGFILETGRGVVCSKTPDFCAVPTHRREMDMCLLTYA